MATTKPDDALLDLFEETVEKKVTKVDDKQLKSLAENMNAMLELGGQVGNAEEKLKQLKEKYRQYSEEIIPEQMQSMGLSSLSMDDGSRVSVAPFYSARIFHGCYFAQWFITHESMGLRTSTIIAKATRGPQTSLALFSRWNV